MGGGAGAPGAAGGEGGAGAGGGGAGGGLNHRIYQLYSRHDTTEALALIEAELPSSRGAREYPLYVKGLIRRQEGRIRDSLQLFQQVAALNPSNISNLKQVGRSLFLLGKHKAAIEVYREAQNLGIEDWELYHNKGLCHMYLKQYDQAVENFKSANAIHRHDNTYI